jgi:hypothetical protein
MDSISFHKANTVLFAITSDGTIVRGEGFTTVDEMSLAFWEAVERNAPRVQPMTQAVIEKAIMDSTGQKTN